MKTVSVALALLFFVALSRLPAQSTSGYIPPGTMVTAVVNDENVTSEPPDWQVKLGECYLFVKLDDADSSMCLVQVGNTAVRAKATDFRIVTENEMPQAVAKYKKEIADDQANFPGLQLGVNSEQPQLVPPPSRPVDTNPMGTNGMPSREQIDHIGKMLKRDAEQRRARAQNSTSGTGTDPQSSPTPTPRDPKGTVTVDGKKFRLPTQAEINKARILSQKTVDPLIISDQSPQPKATPTPVPATTPAPTPFARDLPK